MAAAATTGLASAVAGLTAEVLDMSDALATKNQQFAKMMASRIQSTSAATKSIYEAVASAPGQVFTVVDDTDIAILNQLLDAARASNEDAVTRMSGATGAANVTAAVTAGTLEASSVVTAAESTQ